jgi:AbrB family looped-hinge helix DNA binding protein
VKIATCTIGNRGRLTIPVEVRRRLDLRAGGRVEFVFEEGKTVLRPVRSEVNPFEAWVGAFPAFSTREEIPQHYRELRGHDEIDEKLL